MIELIGVEGSDEYAAALLLRDAFIKTWPTLASCPPEEDHVKIIASAKLSNHKVSDIDIVVAGLIRTKRYIVPSSQARDTDGNSLVGKKIRVRSFVVAIEVKGQGVGGLEFSAGGVKARYSNGWKDATGQNDLQKYALLKSLQATTSTSPHVFRCVMLTGIPTLPKERGRIQPEAGAIPAGFDATNFLVAAAMVNGISKSHEPFISSGDEGTLERILEDPLFKVLVPTSLDRRRMDRIASRPAEAGEISDLLGHQRVHLRGNGGTGKTILLLQSAYEAFLKHGTRSLVLTYNTALAADIQRTLALMGIPGDGEAGGISVRTVMSFIYGWLSKLGLVEGDDIGFESYEAKCAEALRYIAEGAIKMPEIDALKNHHATELGFDAILVDEAQDWPQVEANLLAALYGGERIALADGLSQLVRGSPTNWKSIAGVGDSRKGDRSLRDGLRMKANLCKFANSMAEQGNLQWNVTPNKQAAGGRIIVAHGNYAAMDSLHEELLASTIKAGNMPIDMLHCAPPSTVAERDGKRFSTLAEAFAKKGWETWDAVDERTRRMFPRSNGALRVIQHESCRGLEGWVTVLDGLDEFWELKQASALAQITSGQSQGVVDPCLHASAVAWRWCMIPLTRPIDTLVITLRNKTGPMAEALRHVAASQPDIVEMYS